MLEVYTPIFLSVKLCVNLAPQCCLCLRDLAVYRHIYLTMKQPLRVINVTDWTEIATVAGAAEGKV